MVLSRSDMIDIDNEGCNALQEYLASCTVIITSEAGGFEHGTGVAVRYDNQDYILTADHVLTGEPDDDKIMIVGRPAAPIQEVKKDHLHGAVFGASQKPVTFSAATHITITQRLAGKVGEDIAALKLQDAKTYLPHTIFHDLSDQGETHIDVGAIVHLFGFPGELAQQVKHRVTKQSGAAAFPYFAQQKIGQLCAAPDKLDSSLHFVTDFTYDDTTCDPKGMSGCGVWSIPQIEKGKLWLPSKSQLLGIQSGVYRKAGLVVVVRIERVLDLLSGG